MQQRFVEAQGAYRAVLANGALADRKKAVLVVALIDWMVDVDSARAMRDLRAYAAYAPSLTMMSRARLDAGNITGARSAARRALALSRDPEERQEAAAALGDAVSLPYERSCIDSAAPRPDPRGDSVVSNAIVRLRAVVTIEAGRLDPAQRLVRLAVITGDWSSLAVGWRSYYIVGRRLPDGPLARAENELRAMEGARGSEKPAHAFAALVDSKMFEPAALLATCGPFSSHTPDSATAELIAYARFLRDARRITNSYYRTIAGGHANVEWWRAALDSSGRRLWPRLIWSGAPPAYSQDSLIAQLDARFGLVVNAGKTGDALDLHSGHRISDENREVQQYGKSAHVRFAVLDGMISDGYQTWAWDGRAAHGGWATDVTILQVRDGYAEGPLRAWHAITDPALIAREAKTIARDSVADTKRARETETAYYPSIEARLRRNARLELRDSLRRAGLSGRALEVAFVRAYGDYIDESSIFVHEGRHAIDKTIHVGDSSDKNLEYQAKLSELAFAPMPKVALAGMLGGNNGDDSPHGIANARVTRELLAWMRDHGFSDGARAAPLLLQIPRLNNEQLRAFARSLDPLAAQSAAASAAP